MTGHETDRGRRGFTLIELLVSLAVLAVLIGLLLVGIKAATAGSREAADKTTASSLHQAAESFRQQMGFHPPMVQDKGSAAFRTARDPRNGPIFEGPNFPKAPVGFLTSADPERTLKERDFLEGESGNPLERFSIHTIPYYLLGALAEDIDGVQGPGFMQPRRDGSFQLGGRRFEPLYDIGRDAKALFYEDGPNGRIELRDRRGTPIRYYTWAEDSGIARPGDKDVFNIPELVGTLEDTRARGASFAIVMAGPNGVFGDELDLVPPTMTLDEFYERLGISRGTPLDKAKRIAREDNIVEVGR